MSKWFVRCLSVLMFAGLSLLSSPATSASSTAGIPPPPALVSAIMKWLSIELGLPSDLPAPSVRLAPARKIATFRYTGLLSDHPRDMAEIPPGQRETGASYASLARTILLPDGWTGATAAGVSILVHEMVHHLQHVGGLRYECPQASEKLAYDAQQKWLRLYGRDLELDFDLDGFTLLVATQCFY